MNEVGEVLRNTVTKEEQRLQPQKVRRKADYAEKFLRPQSLKGFTYLEILAAMLIMTIALIPIMRIMPEGMRATRRIERSTRAALLAQEKMDEIRSQILGIKEGYGFTNDYNESAMAFPETYGQFKYKVTDDEGTNIKVLNVTVWFDENDNDEIDTYSEAYREDEVSVGLDVKIANRGEWQTE